MWRILYPSIWYSVPGFQNLIIHPCNRLRKKSVVNEHKQATPKGLQSLTIAVLEANLLLEQKKKNLTTSLSSTLSPAVG